MPEIAWKFNFAISWGTSPVCLVDGTCVIRSEPDVVLHHPITCHFCTLFIVLEAKSLSSPHWDIVDDS